MTRHDDSIRMRHMLVHGREALDMIRDRQREELQADRMLQLALTRLVEIVGEAASRVSHLSQQQHPQIPWLQIRGLRNRLVHSYDAVDLDILWVITQQDLPRLVEWLQGILGEKGDPPAASPHSC